MTTLDIIERESEVRDFISQCAAALVACAPGKAALYCGGEVGRGGVGGVKCFVVIRLGLRVRMFVFEAKGILLGDSWYRVAGLGSTVKGMGFRVLGF